MTDVGIRNGGLRKTISALTYAWSWANVWASLGHEPTMEEYWTWWNQSRASAYRELQAWEACFPAETVSAFVVRAGLLERFEVAVEAWREAGADGGSPAQRRRAFEPLLSGLMGVEAAK